MKVLIADGLEQEGIELFKGKSWVKADVYASMTPEELKAAISGYEGLIVRSASKVTARLCHQQTVSGSSGGPALVMTTSM